MADGSASKSPTRGSRTICLPVVEESYHEIVKDSVPFRAWLDEAFQACPELFPEGFAQGCQMKDQRTSKKSGVTMRRIQLPNGECFTVRPSFIMPYMTARTDDVEKALFLRKFGVPFWALARVFGRDHMYWYRMECSLGRNSLVGTTVRKAEIPEHLVADEHHQTRQGEKVFVATTVGGGCVLGAEMAEVAGTDELLTAYGKFGDEAKNVKADYVPKTVNTDGWKGTRAAWSLLFPTVVLLRCFLHAWLKIRDRGQSLGDVYFDLSRRMWEAYRAPDKRTCSQRLRRLKTWAEANVDNGVVQAAVQDLCKKRPAWLQHYDHPEGHRTSNMLDRVMRGMNRYFFDGQHLHGGIAANNRHVRGWSLLSNYAPWHPAVTRANQNWRSPAERLNRHRYHDVWLHNLLISASLGGYRTAPQKT